MFQSTSHVCMLCTINPSGGQLPMHRMAQTGASFYIAVMAFWIQFFVVFMITKWDEWPFWAATALELALEVALFEILQCLPNCPFILARVFQAYQFLSHTVSHLNVMILSAVHFHSLQLLEISNRKTKGAIVRCTRTSKRVRKCKKVKPKSADFMKRPFLWSLMWYFWLFQSLSLGALPLLLIGGRSGGCVVGHPWVETRNRLDRKLWGNHSNWKHRQRSRKHSTTLKSKRLFFTSTSKWETFTFG